MQAQPDSHYAFGDYRLDTARRLLYRANESISMTARLFDTLLYLVQNAGRLVEKRELMTAVWGNLVVEENNLTQTISSLRRLLNERPDEHRYIVTVPGRGYRFIAPVVKGVAAPAADRSSAGALAEPTSSVNSPEPAIPDDSDAFAAARSTSWFRKAAWLSLFVAVLALLAWYWANRRTSVDIETIAVLPFKPLVRGARDEALELGMADTLIARLSGNRSVIVRPLSSVRRYADLEQDPVAAGRELRADAVLDGSVYHAGDSIRVTARLIRVKDGSSIWVGKLDQAWTDLFTVQDSIVEQVASALELRLTSTERRRLTKRDTENAEAYRLYLLGRLHLSRLTPDQIYAGIDYFQQAIAIDSSYALPYAGLAESYRALTISADVRPTDVLPKGKAAALHALQIDAGLDEAQASLCFLQIWSDWDWPAADRSCKRALAINGNSADGHRAYAILLSDLGRHSQAIAEARRARELDPLALITNAIEGHVLFYAGHDEEAMSSLQRTLEIDPNFWITHLFIGKIYLSRNQLPAAMEEFDKARALSHGNSEAISMLGYTLARAGDRAGAQRTLETLRARGLTSYVPPFNIAMIYNGLQDSGSTLDWLERAYLDRDVRLTFIKIERKWDWLRANPRFAKLVMQMRLD
ncbi:MAG: winged helix-turn-helix domain-containing protein [Pseudomonadota bacterium]|nr:winged helix-turn-helix domain-containing protein [Pseudomonadota bacterium]